MNKYLYILIIAVLLSLGTTAFLIWKTEKVSAPSENNEKPEAPSSDAPTEPTPNLTSPISNLKSRKIIIPFGRYFAPGSNDHPDAAICPSAINYVGYHTAVDFEVNDDEQNTAVPIFSAADGIIKRVESASGYGGLIVIEHQIDGKTYTTYYGHLDLKTLKVKDEAPIKAGEKIGELGQACSLANGMTRKHLHFGLRSGSEVDIRGYVPDTKTLSSWIDPMSFLS